jgi:hypothetical protein
MEGFGLFGGLPSAGWPKQQKFNSDVLATSDGYRIADTARFAVDYISTSPQRMKS